MAESATLRRLSSETLRSASSRVSRAGMWTHQRPPSSVQVPPLSAVPAVVSAAGSMLAWEPDAAGAAPAGDDPGADLGTVAAGAEAGAGSRIRISSVRIWRRMRSGSRSLSNHALDTSGPNTPVLAASRTPLTSSRSSRARRSVMVRTDVDSGGGSECRNTAATTVKRQANTAARPCETKPASRRLPGSRAPAPAGQAARDYRASGTACADAAPAQRAPRRSARSVPARDVASAVPSTSAQWRPPAR
ncbi:hypothetical protein COLO4_02255 [Corchorus olitorius]|uniref:Uncharacterized protein n=1 Tax=Corchorus olitorius TaxID=93759 RepID=A0A1R3L1A1_9ROSI|nr:hypothetical protein COLO4_02255 [Corchorus olitorius]